MIEDGEEKENHNHFHHNRPSTVVKKSSQLQGVTFSRNMGSIDGRMTADTTKHTVLTSQGSSGPRATTSFGRNRISRDTRHTAGTTAVSHYSKQRDDSSIFKETSIAEEPDHDFLPAYNDEGSDSVPSTVRVVNNRVSF